MFIPSLTFGFLGTLRHESYICRKRPSSSFQALLDEHEHHLTAKVSCATVVS